MTAGQEVLLFRSTEYWYFEVIINCAKGIWPKSTLWDIDIQHFSWPASSSVNALSEVFESCKGLVSYIPALLQNKRNYDPN